MQEQLDLLPELLKQFLSSPAVNERTDDDKTLALALLVTMKPTLYTATGECVTPKP